MHKLKDKFGRIWNLEEDEVCPECRQPDNTGDCNHHKISTSQYRRLTIQMTNKKQKHETNNKD